MNSLPVLLVDYVAYMGAMALVAWRWERRSGRDAFGLVAAVAGGILTVWALNDGARIPAWATLLVGGAVASVLFVCIEGATDRYRFSLLEVLFIATASLLLFDGVTQHSPVALDSNERHLTFALVGIAGLVWAWELLAGARVTRLTRRVGREGRWVIPYWRTGLTTGKGLRFLVLPLFLPIIGLPLATTGILSSTVLKDIALAILLARVTASRPPAFLLAITGTLGATRLLFGYFVVGSAGPPLVEAAAIIVGLLWLRQKGFRAVLGGVAERAAG